MDQSITTKNLVTEAEIVVTKPTINKSTSRCSVLNNELDVTDCDITESFEGKRI